MAFDDGVICSEIEAECICDKKDIWYNLIVAENDKIGICKGE